MNSNLKHINSSTYEAIAIGTSAGGLKAVRTILVNLPSDFPLSIIIAIHRHASSEDYMEQLLNKECDMLVKQADEKESIMAGVVYIASSNYHLLIEDDKTFSLSLEGPVNYARPSIDVLFESAAHVYGQKLVGIILTGANKDGSQGLKKIKQEGGFVIVQKPETAEFDDMPRAAMATVTPDRVLALEEIGPFLRKLGCANNMLL